MADNEERGASAKARMGTGHPNRIVAVDFAFSTPRRSFAVETKIDLTGHEFDGVFNRLLELLALESPRGNDANAELLQILHDGVQRAGASRGGPQAMKMFVAAMEEA